VTAYYNENDEFAATWLRNLIAANMIAPGDVDERSIEDVVPVELHKYTQCHFFAGIGVWSYAMRRAGWPDSRRAWSGSCPCQPFSQAGEGAGFADERHLWPAFHHLISQCGPDIVFGEQVASPDGLAWLDLVQADMEATGYAFGAVDTCAAGFGAPHQRQRLYWMAYGHLAGLERRPGMLERGNQFIAGPYGLVDGLAHDTSAAGGAGLRDSQPSELGSHEHRNGGSAGGVAHDASGGRRKQRSALEPRDVRHVDGSSDAFSLRPGPTNGFWQSVDWLRCRDERWRPVEPGTFPLVNGAPNRVGLLRGYGNAIVAPQAEEFIRVALGYAP
jgi:DNA (cytosine-5)-methyltransferase 1